MASYAVRKGGVVPNGPRSERSKSGSQSLAWTRRYGLLLRHVASHGAMPREFANPRAEEVEESRLAGWVRYQRRREQKLSLPSWQRELLEQVPGFSWDPLKEQWNEWCEMLRVFLAAERRMPRYRSQDAHERALAAWVHKQRHLHRRGELSEVRVSSLRALPFKVV